MTTQKFTGSCLCRSVRYELDGDPEHFYHCHCSRCRKATGTGHATNIFLKSDGIRWSGDESQIRQYKVPESELFVIAFCGTCGGNLPTHDPETRAVFIPAGSLDSKNEISPTLHLYNGSRAAWSCQDSLPKFEKMPEGFELSE